MFRLFSFLPFMYTDNVETREIKEILFPANGSGRVLQSPRLGPAGGLRIGLKDQGLLLRRRREFFYLLSYFAQKFAPK